jgi:hypothetical protein
MCQKTDFFFVIPTTLPFHVLWAQLVLLNSEFSLHWYSQYIMATLRGLRSQHAPVPTLQVNPKKKSLPGALGEDPF